MLRHSPRFILKIRQSWIQGLWRETRRIYLETGQELGDHVRARKVYATTVIRDIRPEHNVAARATTAAALLHPLQRDAPRIREARMHSMQLRCKPSIALNSLLLFFFPFFSLLSTSSRAPIRESSQPFIIEMQRVALHYHWRIHERDDLNACNSIHSLRDCIVFGQESTL